MLPRIQDAHSPAIFIPGDLVFGETIVKTIYVSDVNNDNLPTDIVRIRKVKQHIPFMQVNENGAFSFEEPWQFSHPNRYPTNYPGTRLKHIISPFWRSQHGKFVTEP